MSLLWVFAYLGLERLLELYVSRRHRQALEARGGREYYPETFFRMAALHALFLGALFWESRPWRIPADAFHVALLTLFVLLQGIRYWCMLSLGDAWNTRIILVPGGSVQKRGPYRLLAHPNYLVVTLEFITLPLLMHAPYTFAVFFPASLLILRERIRLEERALRQFTDYGERFPLESGQSRTVLPGSGWARSGVAGGTCSCPRSAEIIPRGRGRAGPASAPAGRPGILRCGSAGSVGCKGRPRVRNAGSSRVPGRNSPDAEGRA